MTSGRYGLVLREVGRLLGGGTTSSLGSGPLLERFAADRDGPAFEALVTRHGPMVLGTCRRMLSDPHDVDDAFQATFLVLARKAGSIRDADRLGPWLHGVARRISARSRALSSRRKTRERPVGDEPADESPNLLEGFELRAVLDDELARLPEKYRAPLVLCYLEGLTHDEAAEQLRWPVGTVRSRLAGGRDRLRDRLTRRGLAPSAAVPAILTHASIPQALLSTTVRLASAVGTPSAHVLNLAKGALIVMTWNKMKAVATLGLMTSLAVGVAGVAAQQGGAGKAEVRTEATATIEQVDREMARLEAEAEAVTRRIKQVQSEQSQAIGELMREFEEIHSRMGDLGTKLLKSRATSTAPDQSKDRAPGLLTLEELAYERLHLRNEYGEALRKAQWLELRIGQIEAEWKKRGQQASARIDARARNAVDPRLPSEPAPSAVAEADAKASPTPKALTGPTGPNPEPQTKVSDAPPAVDPPPPQPFVYTLQPNPMQNGPVIFAVISAQRDRVTMIDSATKARATFKLPGGAKQILPIVGSLITLDIKGPAVGRTALFDLKERRWYEYDLKEPATEVHTLMGSLMMSSGLEPGGLTIKAPTITQIAAFDRGEKRWTTQDLREPAHGQVSPKVSGTTVAYSVGRFLYTYSAVAKKWAVLELKSGTPPSNAFGQEFGEGKEIITDGDVIHIYDPKAGEWTHISTEDGK